MYLDFAKTFDSVDHTILLAKLRCYGVTGSALDWFVNYLNGRTQRVVGMVRLRNGLPSLPVYQGSILGPLLFVVFINDLPDIVEARTGTALYADDTKLHKTITCNRDCASLQHSLSNLNLWTMENNLRFNVSKCKVLTITRKKNPIIHDYTLGSQNLTRVDSEKDLGITTTSKLVIIVLYSHYFSRTSHRNGKTIAYKTIQNNIYIFTLHFVHYQDEQQRALSILLPL